MIADQEETLVRTSRTQWPTERIAKSKESDTQPHVHAYMFCPYVISTLYRLLKDYKWEISKWYFSHTTLLTTLHLLWEMN
jgi:hypothetical protein